MAEPLDDDLVTAARQGDRAALEQVLTAYAPQAYTICRRIIVNEEDARDAAQEALIAVARSITSFDGSARFTTWAYRVTTNAALDELRRQRRRPIPDEELEPAPTADPTSRIDDRDALERALEGLLPEFRAALVLREFGELGYDEIAAILDVPPGTVRSRIARGRAQLAAILGNQMRTDDRQKDDV